MEEARKSMLSQVLTAEALERREWSSAGTPTRYTRAGLSWLSLLAGRQRARRGVPCPQ